MRAIARDAPANFRSVQRWLARAEFIERVNWYRWFGRGGERRWAALRAAETDRDRADAVAATILVNDDLACVSDVLCVLRARRAAIVREDAARGSLDHRSASFT